MSGNTINITVDVEGDYAYDVTVGAETIAVVYTENHDSEVTHSITFGCVEEMERVADAMHHAVKAARAMGTY